MIELHLQESALVGITKDQLKKNFSQYDLIRQIERYGILEFMTRYAPLFHGRVLDFGSGTQPYRHLVSGQYVSMEKGDPQPVGLFDCIICNQVMQYIDGPFGTLMWFRSMLKDDGYLVMTYATNWDEVEETDHLRITKFGMEHFLKGAGFQIKNHERRSQVCFSNFKFPLGYGVVAKRI